MSVWPGGWVDALRLLRRDWTLYCYAIALLPLTTLPLLPVWSRFANLDINDALITSVILALPTHLLVAHSVICEILDHRTPSR